MEKCNNVCIEKRVALYFKGIRITEYIYDYGESKNGITVMQRGNVIDVYDNNTGKKLYNLFGVDSFKIEKEGIILYDGKYYGMRTNDGTVILRTGYLSINKCKDYLKTLDVKGNLGLFRWKDNTLEEIIKPQQLVDIRVQDNGIVVYKNVAGVRAKGYYSLDGIEIIKPKYKEFSFNSQGIYVTTHGDQKGFCSNSGKEIVPPLYSEIIPVRNCFIVCNNSENGREKFGMYNQKGNLLLKPRYDKFLFNPPFCIFRLGELYCLYDVITGKRILPLKYRQINSYYNVVYATEDFKSFSIFSGKTGTELLKDKFESVTLFAPFVLAVTKNKHLYYYLTLHNTLVDSQKYDVEYSDEYKEVLIGKKGKEEKVLFTEWINKQF